MRNSISVVILGFALFFSSGCGKQTSNLDNKNEIGCETGYETVNIQGVVVYMEKFAGDDGRPLVLLKVDGYPAFYTEAAEIMLMYTGGNPDRFFIAGGFMTIDKDNPVSVSGVELDLPSLEYLTKLKYDLNENKDDIIYTGDDAYFLRESLNKK